MTSVHFAFAERELTKSKEVVPLTPKAFDTLVALVGNSGHVVGKDTLLLLLETHWCKGPTGPQVSSETFP